MSKSLSHLLKLGKFLHPLRRPLTYSYLANRSSRCYGTSIFVSDRHHRRYFEFDHGLEEKFRDMEGLKKLCERRGCKIDVEKLKQDFERVQNLHKEKENLDELRRQNSHAVSDIVKLKVKKENYERVKSLHKEREELDETRRQNSLAVSDIVKQKVKTEESKQLREELIHKGKQLKERFRYVQDLLWDLEQTMMEDALSLPNNLLDNVTRNEEVLESYFEGQEIDTDLHHLDIVQKSGEVVFSNVGNRAYYLRGRLALLEQSLINRFSKHLRDSGLTAMLAPEIFNTPVVESGSIDVTDPDAINRINMKHIDPDVELDWQLDNTFLYGASHLSFLAYFARMVIDQTTPDSKWFVVGRHYRASQDTDLPGLFGVLQSVKVCMCSVNIEESSSIEAMTNFINMLTNFYKQFEIPFRVVSMPINSLSAMEMNRTELQMWVPSIKHYIKIASVSYCGDYSSRRLMIRCAENRNLKNTSPVNMVHSEVTDITKLIGILMEHDKVNNWL